MSLFFFFEDQQNEIIVETLIFISIFLVLTLQLIKFKQCAKQQQKSIYEQSYIKQSPSEFEQNKQQLTKYHIEKLQENPKFKEWQESSKKS
ncbi:unnamed protein product [Paramecium octaurelia]|uniref:Uncharacterized protein n=1 Tax=Paramecium octaurelia TaxID=43137 RepID=A0A8S1TEY4_PAROT|nr:unnamed protein product [Paramecium octaurelia]